MLCSYEPNSLTITVNKFGLNIFSSDFSLLYWNKWEHSPWKALFRFWVQPLKRIITNMDPCTLLTYISTPLYCMAIFIKQTLLWEVVDCLGLQQRLPKSKKKCLMLISKFHLRMSQVISICISWYLKQRISPMNCYFNWLSNGKHPTSVLVFIVD